MTPPSLQLAVAKWVFKLATPRELVEAAREALADGVQSPSLEELARLDPPQLAASYQLFMNLFEEVGLVYPRRKEAALTVLAERFRPISERRKSPVIAMEEVAHEVYLQVCDREWAEEDVLFRQIEDVVDYLAVYEYENAIPGEELDDEFESRRAQFIVDFARRWSTEYGRRQVDPSWLTTTVVGLAKSINAGHDFGSLPALADSLEEAGCTDLAFLKHCRAGTPHTDYCWVTAALVRATTHEQES